MTLDEEIKHCEEVADVCEFEASKYDMTDTYESHVACKEGECAKEHRQLAEWLKELKQLRKQTRWISVNERLPEKNDIYVVWTSKGFGDHLSTSYYSTENGWTIEVCAWKENVESYKAEIINRNLCDSCTNNGCIFQSGIVRNHCDFYKAERNEQI